MRNIKMTVGYDGTRYKGWQKQNQKGSNVSTIQGKIENVLSKMTGEDIQVIGCGRTDTGVHAEDYIANFRTNSELDVDEMFNYLYEFLPEDIAVKSMKDTSERFHARYNVKSKTYAYRIDNNKYRNVFYRKYACHIEEKLDLDAMKKAAEVLIGTHDFQSFTNLKSNTKPTVRTINYISMTENDGMIEIEYNGNGFLLNMVRIMTGTLIEAGKGNLQPEDMERILNAKKRSEAGQVAEAKGLCLRSVQY